MSERVQQDLEATVRSWAVSEAARDLAFTDWFHHDTSDAAFAVLDPTRVAAVVRTRSGRR
ncbi:hypothetical protein [Streptomyces cahuitamycinicus]|uniref:Uncharacterized protein n=1 Tax=Streptomyces cahuitamycinicus TaxID=2070367 RepID=A0A2N8TBP4_9ACTN|nr:hypothetical protein [Streptomyces cahuitamycinicus]PNG16449.1 hypothetical protein C1J00_41870 [Streptomyces cahuitamycinicus]